MSSYIYEDIEYYLKLKEEGEEYRYEGLNFHQPHDKIFKEVLDEKEETVKFLNDVLKIKNTENQLKIDDIEKYNRNFLTLEFINLESDIVYKKVDQNIFFLIEHQSKIDYSMPYRILKYNMAIMESAMDRRKLFIKEYKMPTIYSFVIYTGKQKWNVEKYIAEKQEKLNGVKQRTFANFEVIDVNDYTDKELLEREDLLSKVMLLEKSVSVNGIDKTLAKIFEKDINHKQIYFLKRLVNYILKDKIDINKYNEIINNKLKRSEDNMSFVQIINDYIDERIAESDKYIAGKSKYVDKKEKELEEKDKDLQEKDKDLQEKDKDLQEKDKDLQEKDKSLKEKAKNIKEREKNIDRRVSKIVLEMIKNKFDDSTIKNMLEINEKELLKIKKENHIAI